MSDYKYRYVAARGLERQRRYQPSFMTADRFSSVWSPVTGSDLEEMTPDELRHCADVMEGKDTQ